MILVLLFVFRGRTFQRNLTRSLAYNLAVSALLAQPEKLSSAVQALSSLNSDVSQDCRSVWILGKLNAADDEGEHDKAWEKAIRCSPTYISFIYLAVPDDEELAKLAILEQPASPSSWFWMAEIYAQSAPGEAITYYRQGLQLDPNDGQRWRELGDLLQQDDPQAAIEAYLQSCFNGDPGANGCWRAGRTAETLGDFRAAIEYYRFSRWSGALDRADALAREINGESGSQ